MTKLYVAIAATSKTGDAVADDTSFTYQATFSSLREAFADATYGARDITVNGSDEQLFFDVFDSYTESDGDAISTSVFTDSADNYITIRCAPGLEHGGITGQGVKITWDQSYQTKYGFGGFSRVQDLEFEARGTGSNNNQFQVFDNSKAIRILYKGHRISPKSHNSQCISCVVYDSDGGFGFIDYIGGNLLNCTVLGSVGSGISFPGQGVNPIVCKNCLVLDSGGLDYSETDYGNLTMANCASSDDTAIGDGAITNLDSSLTLQDTANFDVHLKSGNSVQTAGQDLIASGDIVSGLDKDIDGQTYSGWPIGADQPISVVAPSMPADTSVNVAENQTSVGTFAVTAGTAPVSYTLGGDDADLFSINASAEVEFLNAADFETPLDSDAGNDYQITVTATNSAGSDSQNITVNVTDVTDTIAPSMPADTSVNVAENQTTVGTFAATAGTAPISYTLEGDDADLFSINTGGEVAFLAAPDFETPLDVDTGNNYEITVTATNASGSDSQNITVNVTDEAELVSPTMPADTTVSAAENQTTVGTFAATAGTGPISYTLGGDDADLFSINSNADVAFLSAPDFETPLDSDAGNDYQIIVTATNSIGSDIQSITVNVTDVVELVAPSMPADTSVNVAENQTAVGTFAAAGTPPMSYELSGDDADLFSINSSAVVAFLNAPDFENPLDTDGGNDYQITVTASNDVGSDSQDIIVNVDNVDEAPMADAASIQVEASLGVVKCSAALANITLSTTGN